MVAQQSNLDVIANNLANVNTTGFKTQRAEFQDLMYQTVGTAGVSASGSSASPASQQVGLGASFTGTDTNFGEGSMNSTGNPLDVAINGNGFFRVLMPNGVFGYTRDGSFKVDSQGQLVSSDGYPVDPAISIPTDATSYSVSSSGVVSITQPKSSDSIALDPPINVATFPNPGAMERIGQNLYSSNKAAGAEQIGKPGENGSGTLSAGYLEGSNVQVVQEMVNMIMAQRAYEINSKAIQTSDQMLSTASNLVR